MFPFHLAIQVRDIAEARHFYGELLGLEEGRSAADWVDFNLFGHQLVTHLNPRLGPDGQVEQIINGVDGEGVPVPHFGVVLDPDHWEALRAQVVEFVDDPETLHQSLLGNVKNEDPEFEGFA